jgi:hypothetical protein
MADGLFIRKSNHRNIPILVYKNYTKGSTLINFDGSATFEPKARNYGILEDFRHHLAPVKLVKWSNK